MPVPVMPTGQVQDKRNNFFSFPKTTGRFKKHNVQFIVALNFLEDPNMKAFLI
jgi:hypothetical protein